MNPSRTSGILVIISLVALAWMQLDRDGNAHTWPTSGASEIECSARDPLSRCAADLNVGYPLGDGLVFIPFEDFL